MFSDDYLMEMLVLKGGNALDIVYKIADRASMDLDFSISNKFKEDELIVIEEKIKNSLEKTFREENYVVFNVDFVERPKRIKPGMEDFWGGYRVEFKVIERDKYNENPSDLDYLRKHAAIVGKKQRKRFIIDISKFEYCELKEEVDLDGYTIYVYTPAMLAFEKLRAICQQMPEYSTIVKNPGQSARARDFFDIYNFK